MLARTSSKPENRKQDLQKSEQDKMKMRTRAALSRARIRTNARTHAPTHAPTHQRTRFTLYHAGRTPSLMHARAHSCTCVCGRRGREGVTGGQRSCRAHRGRAPTAGAAGRARRTRGTAPAHAPSHSKSKGSCARQRPARMATSMRTGLRSEALTAARFCEKTKPRMVETVPRCGTSLCAVRFV